MRTYETYKDSGLEWLGKVPEHWKVDKFKYQFELITTPSDSSNKIGLENIESTTGRFIKTDNEFEGNGIAFQPNDIVYGKLRPYLQKVWLADFAGNAVGDFYVFRCYETNSPVFIKYVLLSHNFTVEVDGSTYGAKMPRVSYEFIGNLKWSMPPLPEQQTIASYLDHKVSQIDALIAEKEKMVADLKAYRSSVITEAVTKGLDKNVEMKESGVEWIGNIPSTWAVLSLKRCATIMTGGTPSTEKEQYWETPTFPWYTPGDFSEDDIFLKDSSRKLDCQAVEEHAAKVFPKNSVLVVGIGATVGKIGIVETECSANQQVNAVVFDSTVCPLFGAYYLYAAKEYLRAQCNSATLPILNQSTMGELKIVLPPFDEQNRITELINQKVSVTKSGIEEIEQQLSDLKSYKSSLITEAVTGKIDLRGWEQQKE